MSPLVVKIGGSLWRSALLDRWVAALRGYPGEMTIVPGGGPFADAVRAAQPEMGFSNEAAHRMALLAMEQYGLALVDKFPGFALVDRPEEATAAHAAGRIAVWRPSAMTLAAQVDASWEVTSDSLAAFYARRSRAARLLLIKSADVEGGPSDLVDERFSEFVRGLEVFIAGPRALAGAEAILAGGGVAGTRARGAQPDENGSSSRIDTKISTPSIVTTMRDAFGTGSKAPACHIPNHSPATETKPPS